MRCVFAFVLAD
jgi:hypothetical protein